jgi:hypothetical protein
MSTTYRDRIAASKSKLRTTAEPIATALALAALAGSAQAATIYTIENPQPYVINGGGLAFNPFDGSYLEDTYQIGAFPILAANSGGSNVEHASNVSFYQGDPSSFPTWATGPDSVFYTSLAPAGTVLDGSTSFGQTATIGNTDYDAPSTSQPNYFAYKIEQGGGTHYGWVEFSVVPVTGEFGTFNYAMATRFALGDEGESMIVGVPEPTSFVFSIVAGGLLLIRRKR